MRATIAARREPVPSTTPSRFRFAWAIAFPASLLASCNLLPPSLQPASTQQEVTAAPSTPSGATELPAPGPAGPPPGVKVVTPGGPTQSAAQPAETRIYKGTGVFVNPRPTPPPPPPGPQEASLNFEALDVREVAKVILGDYLKESYTVHPAVAGTVT